MAARYGRALRFPAPGQHTATVIFAHGLGDTGEGWAWAVENLRRRRRLDEVKFILPHAPSIPITVNGGMRMPGWYDIQDLGGSIDALRRNEDERGILGSQAYFHQLIAQEVEAGIPADRVVLGGFSQGGAMAVFAGLTAPSRLAGVVGLSCYLLLSLKFRDLVPAGQHNHATPVLVAHGSMDPVIPFGAGQLSYDMLKAMGYNVTMKVYEGMGHTASMEEMDDLEEFLRKALPPKGVADKDNVNKGTAPGPASSAAEGKPDL